MYKPLADSTLQRMKKTQIIELLRMAEHNAKVAQEYLDQQAKNLEDWKPVVHGRWEYTPQTFNTLGLIRCPFCEWWSLDQSIDGIYKYCPNCGAKMDLEEKGKNNANTEID